MKFFDKLLAFFGLARKSDRDRGWTNYYLAHETLGNYVHAYGRLLKKEWLRNNPDPSILEDHKTGVADERLKMAAWIVSEADKIRQARQAKESNQGLKESCEAILPGVEPDFGL